MNAISKINPIEFFDAGIALAAEAAIDLCELGLTFNTEDKDDTVKDFRPYYHKVVDTDSLLIDILVDDATVSHKLLVYNSVGVYISSHAFVQVGATNHMTFTIDTAILTARVGSKIFFAVWREPDTTLLWLSDLHSIVASTTRSVLITYQNPNIDYNYVNKLSLFTIRIAGAFMKPGYPETIESDELTTGTVLSLNTSVKEQRLLKIIPVPGYMLFKLKLLLKCSSVSIKSVSWAQEEPLDITWINEDHEFGWGRVMLTKQGSSVRNVYATS